LAALAVLSEATRGALLVGTDVPLQICSVDCVNPGDQVAVREFVERGRRDVISSKELLYMVIDVGSVLLCDNSQGP
jgi:hypothetical protein